MHGKLQKQGLKISPHDKGGGVLNMSTNPGKLIKKATSHQGHRTKIDPGNGCL